MTWHRWAIMKDGKEIGNLGWFTEDCEELYILDHCKEKDISIGEGEEVKIVEAK